ncbi:MAG: dihydroxyacetone kinase subunit L [Anaerolineae bacterium]|nr:dihydroxyacetone kinase subunit L [Anaerolineae bacterium]
MGTSLTYAEAVQLLVKLSDDAIASKDELTELDAALGDGDLGRTVERGFRAVQGMLLEGDVGAEADLGKLLFKTGKTFSTAAASSFGALLGTAFMKGGTALKGQTEASASDIIKAMRVSLTALIEQGKANIGDKTMLDAMNPAIDAMSVYLANHQDDVTLASFLRVGANAAQEGAEHTQSMQSQIGRASWQGARSIGHMDPGARAVAIMLNSVANYFEQKLQE